MKTQVTFRTATGVFLLSVAMAHAQTEETEPFLGYFAIPFHYAKSENRILSGQALTSRSESFYSGFRVAFYTTTKRQTAISLAYSNFVYQMPNTNFIVETIQFFDDESDNREYQKRSRGEKVNHYKVLVEIHPSEIPWLFFYAGPGIMNYKNFETDARDRGVSLNAGAGIKLNHFLGFDANYYFGNYTRRSYSGSFKGFTVGVFLRLEDKRLGSSKF